ncbi:protein commissureless 2 [Lucilia sericata]|uniref:protein commissureless 2 n=1 Tax=Lucilia sericata TaxID=13632 RepID=UPI0018A851E2|nr:protein commissureless 2 [Lucilia sericata]
METITRSLNYEQPQDLHFDKYALHILENSRTPNLADTTTIALASSPSISSFEGSATQPLTSTHITTTSEFFKKLGVDFFQSLQSQALPKSNNLDTFEAPIHTITTSANSHNMELDLGRLIMDSSVQNNAMDELQTQLNYDKFMNGIWIGVVLALILISMIFCFCSCFLYHQFRVWKRNYRTTVTQNNDVEAVKLNLDMEDPVPEYTLVSGLPSYEAALELLHKTPKSCLIVHPSVFEVFNEKPTAENSTTTESSTTPSSGEVSQPLLNSLPSYTEATNTASTPSTPSTLPVLTYNHSLASLLSLNQSQKSQSKSKMPSSGTTDCVTEKPFKS